MRREYGRRREILVAWEAAEMGASFFKGAACRAER